MRRPLNKHRPVVALIPPELQDGNRLSDQHVVRLVIGEKREGSIKWNAVQACQRMQDDTFDKLADCDQIPYKCRELERRTTSPSSFRTCTSWTVCSALSNRCKASRLLRRSPYAATSFGWSRRY
jgi:hypothetical protein